MLGRKHVNAWQNCTTQGHLQEKLSDCVRLNTDLSAIWEKHSVCSSEVFRGVKYSDIMQKSYRKTAIKHEAHVCILERNGFTTLLMFSETKN